MDEQRPAGPGIAFNGAFVTGGVFTVVNPSADGEDIHCAMEILSADLNVLSSAGRRRSDVEELRMLRNCRFRGLLYGGSLIRP